MIKKIREFFGGGDEPPQGDREVQAGTAHKLILNGKAKKGMRVDGVLDFTGEISKVPLPDDLDVNILKISNHQELRRLPAGLKCFHLQAQRTQLTTLPADLKIDYKLDLSDSTELTHLPDGLTVPALNLSRCVSLRRLGENLTAKFLDLAGCTALEGWPQNGSVSEGRLNIRGCVQVKELPHWLHSIAQLDIGGCPQITRLPDNLVVNGWIELAGTGLKELPPGCRGTELRWRGVRIDERVAFQPESITHQEILDERNAELRRVMLERCGYERFLQQAKAQVIDTDRDPGGERRLLRVPIEGDEDLVCVAVLCPSTGRQYIIRVPPDMKSCRQAVAWIAGFDNPDDYNPIKET